jgi:hypothetical protein
MSGWLEFGRRVRCSDGAFGELEDVVIDPGRRQVTHLVVVPEHPQGQARLVPIELADSAAGGGAIALRCTLAEGHALPPVREIAYLRLGTAPDDSPDWDVGVRDVYSMPSYDAGAMVEYHPDPDPAVLMRYDRVPKGEAELRRDSDVLTADGHHLGTVDAFLVQDGRITHVVLRRGHLWGQREVSVPVAAFAEVRTDGITLRLTKAEVHALPSASRRRWVADHSAAP